LLIVWCKINASTFELTGLALFLDGLATLVPPLGIGAGDLLFDMTLLPSNVRSCVLSCDGSENEREIADGQDRRCKE
jgi:hypothetical protein